MSRVAALISVVCLLVGCSSTGASLSANRRSPAQQPLPSPTFHAVTAIIQTKGGPVLIYVQVAETPRERAYGLMHRTSLPQDSGMVFIFFKPTSAGFWMKDTLIPLSIAFFDAQGRILRILDMEPCRKTPCTIYRPGVAYSGALEVNQGAFDRWGVAPGDVVHVNQ
jgi:uncharacterized membrane protein (UPF0127 family)